MKRKSFFAKSSHSLVRWNSICSPFELRHRRVGELPLAGGACVALDLFERTLARDRHDLVRGCTACTATLSAQKEDRLAAVLHPLLFVFAIMLLLAFASCASRADLQHRGRWRRVGGWENSQSKTPNRYRNLRRFNPATSLPRKFNAKFQEPDSKNCFVSCRCFIDGTELTKTPASFVETGRSPSYS